MVALEVICVLWRAQMNPKSSKNGLYAHADTLHEVHMTVYASQPSHGPRGDITAWLVGRSDQRPNRHTICCVRSARVGESCHRSHGRDAQRIAQREINQKYERSARHSRTANRHIRLRKQHDGETKPSHYAWFWSHIEQWWRRLGRFWDHTFVFSARLSLYSRVMAAAIHVVR